MGLTHFDGVSVYGSGLWYGKKNLETPMFGAGTRADAGTTGFSGMILSVSTRLSTITSIAVAPKYVASGLFVSGAIGTVGVDFSGHTFDLMIGYTNTSAGMQPATSGIVSWHAFGY